MAFVTGQKLTAAQLNTAFAGTFPAGSISSYSASILVGTTQGSWFTALGLPASAPGFPNGLAVLNGSGVIPLSQIPASLIGAFYSQGGWDATANNPALVSSVGTKGFFYTVTTAGATNLDGNNTWSVGDNLFFDGTIWRKINGSGNVSIPSTNISDSTAVGRALLTSTNVSTQRQSLNIDQAQLVVDTNSPTIINSMEAIVWTSLTAPRTGALAAASTFSAGKAIFVFDESGNCSLTNTITVTTPDTINGVASYVLNKPYAGVALFRASVAKWTALPFAPAPNNFVPAGAIMAFFLAAAPSGWVVCDGTNGTPDLRGYFIRGLDTGGAIDPGRTLGDLQQDQLQDHTHGYLSPDGSVAGSGGAINAGAISNTTNNPNSGNHGGETRPKNRSLLYCMKI